MIPSLGGMILYPINIRLEGVPCLVIGGGHVALRKIKKLLLAHAKVTVLAPVIEESISLLWKGNQLQWRKKWYEEGDCIGYRMVVTACGNSSVAEAVGKESEKEHFLYNASDFPHLGNCYLPASFTKGGIHISVSTEGRSPAMAKYVKKWLSEVIPDELGEWLDRVSQIRVELKEQMGNSQMRETFWRMVFDESVMHLVIEGKLDEAEECVRHAIGCFRSEL